MKRLTQNNFDYCSACNPKNKESCMYHISAFNVKCGDAAIYERLREFEKIGLEPMEISALCKMEKRSRMAQMLRWEQAAYEGRLLVLPNLVTIDGLKERLMRALEPGGDEAETYTSGYHSGFRGGYAQALRLVLGINSEEKEAELLSASEEKQSCTER